MLVWNRSPFEVIIKMPNMSRDAIHISPCYTTIGAHYWMYHEDTGGFVCMTDSQEHAEEIALWREAYLKAESEVST